MGVEAARNALHSLTDTEIKKVSFCSTSQPFKDRSAATLAANALNLPHTVFATDHASSRRAGTSALLQSLLHPGAGEELIIASEKRIAQPGSWAEISWGDGAAAVVTDDTAPVAALAGWHSCHEDYVDFYWADGYAPYQGEERWIKDTVLGNQIADVANRALSNAGLTPDAIQWAVLPEPVPGSEKQLMRKLALNNAEAVSRSVLSEIGDLGNALPLVGLARAMEKANSGDHILVVGFGNGCDALVLKMLQPLPKSDATLTYQNDRCQTIGYTQFATARGNIDLDFGPRAERDEKTSLSVHERVRKSYTPFIGGKHHPDAAVQFPKSPIAFDHSFVSDADFIDVPLANLQARVVSITADHLIYTPEPPLYFGLVEFDNGARLPMEFTDIPDSGLQVGDSVRMEFRIKTIDNNRGYRHYFWKAIPISSGGQA